MAAVVLGESGTIIKILVGAIGGNASKKRVALGNLLFNISSPPLHLYLKPILH
jgi:phosphate:Na+ symporter